MKAILTKPLDGHPEGSEREFDEPDFNALRAMGAVRAADEPQVDVGTAKAAPPVLNKMEPAPANKAVKTLETK